MAERNYMRKRQKKQKLRRREYMRNDLKYRTKNRRACLTILVGYADFRKMAFKGADRRALGWEARRKSLPRAGNRKWEGFVTLRRQCDVVIP